MRFAKLEQNIIVAFFILMFDYDLSDWKGNIVSTPTPINLNAFSAMKPDPKVYLRYKVRDEVRKDR
jgi:sterol 14-demethylase